jgi:hypothetical protein
VSDNCSSLLLNSTSINKIEPTKSLFSFRQYSLMNLTVPAALNNPARLVGLLPTISADVCGITALLVREGNNPHLK